MYSIGADIGGSHISCGMYEHSNKGLIKETLVYHKVNSKGSKNEIIDTWVKAISKTIELAKVPIEGIGVAMPGPFNYYEGISLISEVDKLESLYGVNIRQELAEKLNTEPLKIRFINDATAFSIAEALIGKAAGYRRSVAITLGTGFGSSFLKDGQPVVEGEKIPDGGFLYDKPYGDQLADDVFSTRGIKKKYQELSTNEVNNVKELCERIGKDEKAKMVFKWFGMELGNFLKPYLDDFDTEVLVVGGNIGKAYEHFKDELVQQLPGVVIYVSDFGEEAAIIGSALLLDNKYYSELKPTLKLM